LKKKKNRELPKAGVRTGGSDRAKGSPGTRAGKGNGTEKACPKTRKKRGKKEKSDCNGREGKMFKVNAEKDHHFQKRVL